MTTEMTTELHFALDDFAEAFTMDTDLVSDTAESFRCEEVEAFAAVLRALGFAEAANAWIIAHASGDDSDDDHYWPNWYQPVCDDCWNEKHSRRPRHSFLEPGSGNLEKCCRCGLDTRSGIYMWVDPATVDHPTDREDDSAAPTENEPA